MLLRTKIDRPIKWAPEIIWNDWKIPPKTFKENLQKITPCEGIINALYLHIHTDTYTPRTHSIATAFDSLNPLLLLSVCSTEFNVFPPPRTIPPPTVSWPRFSEPLFSNAPQHLALCFYLFLTRTVSLFSLSTPFSLDRWGLPSSPSFVKIKKKQHEGQ